MGLRDREWQEAQREIWETQQPGWNSQTYGKLNPRAEGARGYCSPAG